LRRGSAVLVLSLVLCAVAATPAAAAPTRPEYIAQVDPICQSSAGPLGTAWGAYHRAYKRTTHAAKVGNFKAFLSGTKKESVTLNQLSRTRTGMLDQIAAVPPPDADAGTIGVWLTDLRNESAFEAAAASAALSLKINKFFKKLGQADKAWNAGKVAIAGFGFQACGVFPVQ
jgi:hypothetical protein